MFQKRFLSDGDECLGHRVCEGLQPCAEASCEDHATSCCQDLLYALFAVAYMHLDAEFPVNVLGQVLCAVDAAMLAACASEAEHKAGEASLHIAVDMCIGQLVDALQEGEDFTIVFKEADDRLVESRQLFIGFVTTGVVCASAVEDVSSAIAAFPRQQHRIRI